MPKAKTERSGRQAAAAPYKKGQAAKGGKKGAAAQKRESLFEKRPKNFGIGQDIQPKRDLTRFVRWPKYVRLQRQKRVLFKRLMVPPTVNQFSRTLDKTTAQNLFAFLDKYKPETKAAKQARLKARAAEIAALKEGEKPSATEKPHVVKYGINHVTALIEAKKAQLVVIAHDVEPLELVLWLPALCRKMGVAYCIVKGKARLGQVVHKKTATVLAITTVQKQDVSAFNALKQSIYETYNERYDDLRKQWGGGTLGRKSLAAQKKKGKAEPKAE
ncbi:60S ribosomal protein L8 [Balamuthia mandrillaris]